MPREVRVYLEDLLAAVERIRLYTGGLDRQDLDTQPMAEFFRDALGRLADDLQVVQHGVPRRPGPCGWLKDSFGLSWQVVPPRLLEMLADGDAERVQRVGAALQEMQKIDLARLEQAYSGS